MKWFLGLLLAAVVAAAVVAGGLAVPSDAASVNGSVVSRSTLNADLAAIAGSPGYQCFLGADLTLTGQSTTGLFPVAGAGGTTANATVVNGAFANHWLGQLMENELVAETVAARRLAVTPDALVLGRQTLVQQMSGVFAAAQSTLGQSCGGTATQVLASLPAAFVHELVQAQAEQDVLLAHEAGYGLGTSALARYYFLHPVQFDTICVSYVAFATQAAAVRARAAVAAGAALSTTGSVTQLGCAVRATITSLPSSVTSLGAGQVSQPLAGPNGQYALLQVTSVRHSALAAVKDQVEQVLLAAGSARTTALLRVESARAIVSADPRYGRVVPHSIGLLPPKSPPVAAVLNAGANVPGAPVAPGTATPGATGTATPGATGAG